MQDASARMGMAALWSTFSNALDLTSDRPEMNA